MFLLLVILGSVTALAVIAGVSFYAGKIYSERYARFHIKNEKNYQEIEFIILKLFSSIQSLINIDRTLNAMFDLIRKSDPDLDIYLFRFDGVKAENVQESRTAPQVQAELNEIFQRYSQQEAHHDHPVEYHDFDHTSDLFQVEKHKHRLKKHDTARLYPISFDYLGVRYFLLLFMNKDSSNVVEDQFLLYVKRLLYFLLYLKEMLVRFKDNQELLDGVLVKNPIPMCLTDETGAITRSNKAFSALFARDFDNIQKMMDESSFNKFLDGNTNERDFYYDKKNLKVRGTPLYAVSGDVRGFLFTIHDDSLQYLLYKRLEASEERYKKLLKELPVGLVIVNKEGTIYFVNDNFVNSLGFTDPDLLMGNHLQDFFDMPYYDFKEITKQISENTTLYYKFQLKGKYGNRIFSVHLQKILLVEEDLIEAIFQDISLENRLYAQLEEKSKMMEEELNTARKVWEHILSIPPIYSSVIRFETFFKPSSQLGGDFYDILQIDDTHIGVIIADVSGHGVSASLITSMLKMLVEFAPRDPHRIDDMMSYLNIALLKILPEDQFITLFFGMIDTKNYSIEYINCGHPYPVIYDDRTGETVILKGMTFPLGTKRNIPYADNMHKAKLPPSSKILLYTDGILTFKKPDRLLKMEDLVEVFLESVYLQAKDILNDMYMKIIKFSSQFTDDDVSMLLITISKEAVYKKHFSIPSNVLEIDNAIMKINEGISKLVEVDQEDNWKLYTALYEAIINGMEHGNKSNVQKRINISYRISGKLIVLKIRDEGIGFDTQNIPNPLDDTNLLKPSGRGVYMMKKIMEKVKYNRAGNEVTMSLLLKKKESETK
jgi:PAS domain S-box-containing protein